MKSHQTNQKPHNQPESERIVEQLGLPRDLFLGMPVLSLQGNRFLCIENHRGILQAGREKIVVAAKPWGIEVAGRELSIVRFTKDYMEITGYLEHISFLL